MAKALSDTWNAGSLTFRSWRKYSTALHESTQNVIRWLIILEGEWRRGGGGGRGRGGGEGTVSCLWLASLWKADCRTNTERPLNLHPATRAAPTTNWHTYFATVAVIESVYVCVLILFRVCENSALSHTCDVRGETDVLNRRFLGFPPLLYPLFFISYSLFFFSFSSLSFSQILIWCHNRSLSPPLSLSLSHWTLWNCINQLLIRTYNICLWYCRVYLCF